MNYLDPLFVKIIKAGNFATPASAQLYRIATLCLGQRMHANTAIDNEDGCAESVNNVVFKAFGDYAGGDLSTTRMYLAIQNNAKFVQVTTPIKGDILISPTGYGNGQLSNGHTGIVGDNGQVMSNNSDTGLWDIHYTLDSWKARYVTLGGFPMLYYRRVFM